MTDPQMGAGEALFLFLVALALLLGLFLLLSAVASVAGLFIHRVRPAAPPKLIMPERYVGCVTCEALDGMGSVQRMVRHQIEEHAGGVRW